jgi:hypothetical protein
MRDDTHHQTPDVEHRPAGAAAGSERRATGPAGATVSIPPRTAAPAAWSIPTLQARLALLRPQPLRLRPDRGDGS